MKYDFYIIGMVVRQLRQSKEMSQEVLSGLAGIARSHLAMIETGKKVANVETLWKIAQALEMPLSELIRHAENEMKRKEYDINTYV